MGSVASPSGLELGSPRISGMWSREARMPFFVLDATQVRNEHRKGVKDMSRVLTFLAVGLVVCGTAFGGPLATHADAWTDSEARTWRGSTDIQMTDPGDPEKELSATVEWAVFADGDFPYADGDFTPTTGEFTYAYQIEVTGDYQVNKAWVNMKPSNEANNVGVFDLTSGVEPTSADWGETDPEHRVSAIWLFSGFDVGEVSNGLAYNSINEPVDWLGFIQDGGLIGSPQGTMPSPGDIIPEPATIGVLLLGAGALIGLRRRGK